MQSPFSASQPAVPAPDLPTVSIISPALNAATYIERFIESLLAQDYPRHLVDIVIVDNGSEDDTVARLARYPVRVLHQPHRGSPGATRNLGIINTTGEIVALVDSDVSLEPSWLRIGVTSLLERGADLVAGRIDLYYVFGGTAAEMFDALFHARNEVLVERHSRATTANLLVRRRVFNAVGLFPEITSGEDSIFTFRSVQQGFRLIYEPAPCRRPPDKAPGRTPGQGASCWRRVWRCCCGGGAHDRPGAKDHLQVVPSQVLSRYPAGDQGRGRPDMQNRVAGIWAVSLVYGYVWGMAALRSLLRAR